jgi:hypothetical protein
VENGVENFPVISDIFSSHLTELLINKQIAKLYNLESLDAFLLGNWKKIQCSFVGHGQVNEGFGGFR